MNKYKYSERLASAQQQRVVQDGQKDVMCQYRGVEEERRVTSTIRCVKPTNTKAGANANGGREGGEGGQIGYSQKSTSPAKLEMLREDLASIANEI